MQIQFFSFCLWHACSHSFKCCLENSTKEIFVWSQTSLSGLLRSKNKRVLIAGCVEERYMQILVCEETINSLFSAVQQWGPTHVIVISFTIQLSKIFLLHKDITVPGMQTDTSAKSLLISSTYWNVWTTRQKQVAIKWCISTTVLCSDFVLLYAQVTFSLNIV